jgi:hypothetical protein
MTNDAEPTQPSNSSGQDSTVTDWHGQEVGRDMQAADDALALADGDESAAEEIFDDIRPEHASDQFKVPAEEREGTIASSTSDTDETDPSAVRPGAES